MSVFKRGLFIFFHLIGCLCGPLVLSNADQLCRDPRARDQPQHVPHVVIGQLDLHHRGHGEPAEKSLAQAQTRKLNTHTHRPTLSFFCYIKYYSK
jgi:hypothetical protein